MRSRFTRTKLLEGWVKKRPIGEGIRLGRMHLALVGSSILSYRSCIVCFSCLLRRKIAIVLGQSTLCSKMLLVLKLVSKSTSLHHRVVDEFSFMYTDVQIDIHVQVETVSRVWRPKINLSFLSFIALLLSCKFCIRQPRLVVSCLFLPNVLQITVRRALSKRRDLITAFRRNFSS